MIFLEGNLQTFEFNFDINLCFDSKYLIENYGGVFHNCWQKLENYVREYRQLSGEPPTIEEGAFQRRHLETFAKKCAKYTKKFPKTTTNKI